jgi:4-amino-4-deoxy-L-arabinose transferase-like glycosyltransferase
LLLLLAVLLAAFFRFYQLGHWPPGLYRDEAYNGLDATAVLGGDLRLFFPANNGREPLYIYLVALAIALLGPTALAVRLPAAVAGTLTTLPTYLLARDWFGRTTGLLAALVWATTFWPVHLSRIGLRIILLAPLLALAFWLGTRAYRSGRSGAWALAGAVYGLTFYTYLAARFTPLVLVAVAVYLLLTGRRDRLWAGGRALWFLAGTAVVLIPFAILAMGDPGIILGRSGQVSVLNPAVNGGDLLGTLWSQTGRAVGMFLWRGDTILRHNALLDYTAVLPEQNPQGRPVFDWLMAGPLLIGLGWCLAHWRRPAAATLLLWQIIMLGPTILAEDAPHFLRAAGLLPGLVLLPAIGLNAIWRWERPPAWLRRGVVIVLLAGSAILTARDYAAYGREPEVGYLFEAAAADLATQATADSAGASVWVDGRFYEGWPSVPFLLTGQPVNLMREGEATRAAAGEMVRYDWPYGSLAGLGASAVPPVTVSPAAGPLARGDLEPAAYPLFTRTVFTPGLPPATRADTFDAAFRLRDAAVTLTDGPEAQIALTWELPPGAPTPAALPSVFVHVLGLPGEMPQADAPLAGGLWPGAFWAPGVAVTEQHTIALPQALDPARHRIVAGLYWPDSQKRLPLSESGYTTEDDQVQLWPAPGSP